MKNLNTSNKTVNIIILGLLTAIGPFSIDMYLPAFPDITRSLNTTISQVTLSLSSFFIGISAGQLLYGPLLERFGRKKPLYFGLTVYLLASVGCAFATRVEMLIGLRFLQALGGCAGMVAARAMVRDLFDVKENAKIFSLLMLVVAISPIIAPTLGGYVTDALGWRYIFAMLIIVNAFILVGTYLLLPESKAGNPDFSLKPVPIITSFMGIIKHPQFSTYAFTAAVSHAGLYAYISGSPNVFMKIFQVTGQQYGWIFAFVAMGLIGSSQINNILLKKYSSQQVIRVALFCQSIIGLVMVATVLAGWNGLFVTIMLIFIFLCCQGFISPNASALSLAPMGHTAGNASALMGAIQMGIGASVSALVGVIQDDTSLPMSGMMAFCAITALFVLWRGRKIIVRRASIEKVEEEEIDLAGTL